MSRPAVVDMDFIFNAEGIVSTKAEVMWLAEQRAEMDVTMQFMAESNMPTDSNKRISAMVELAVLRDKRDAVNMEYAKAFGEWRRRGFPETESGL